MAAVDQLRTRESLARLAARESASPDHIRLLQTASPWFANYLLTRRRRGIHVLGTRWKDDLL